MTKHVSGSAQFLDGPSYASCSIETILAIVIQYASSPWMVSQVVESCMKHQANVARCLLKIIATSNSSVRAIASNLLFHYYPQCKQSNVETDFSYVAWKPPKCMNPKCADANCRSAYYTCCPKDAACIAECPPPLYICKDCAESGVTTEPGLRILPGPLESPLAKRCQNPVGTSICGNDRVSFIKGSLF